ncbi:MAG: energy transducer TonB [Armatimonadota bacterium]|nr:energy transducer TonB [Armatimonadota bacterium]MDR7449253.1 energy transducer TonB [Armatimonadota bacterium]MDR7459315.1 energy transducer TonB [Armatimonadota bacterium]MDR7478313.1 energy transducer TonB [Armatimonadota bacterium]MDR7487244.1 energy transducer TonB [Armatimonadota bacterium]
MLTPPTVLEAPPLHPLLRGRVTAGPGEVSALEQVPVRGRLRVRLLVRTDGSVGQAVVVVPSGDPALDRVAVEGLRRWRFAPARRDGVPIEAYLLLWVTFHD